LYAPLFSPLYVVYPAKLVLLDLSTLITYPKRRSQWPCGLRRRSAVACLLRSWVRIPQGTWIFVCCECCVLSGRGLCDGLITRPEESYRLWRFVVCDQETSKTRRLKPATGLWKIKPQWVVTPRKQTNKPSQNTVAVCNQVTLLILYYISSRLVILLKLFDAPILFSDIFDHTVNFTLINFSI
jgi:hypothetical protein